MAQAALVETQIKEGQTFLDRLAHEGVEVTAAAWVKESDSGYWFLYLATPLVRKDGAKDSAYRRVNNVLRKMEAEGLRINAIEKKVIGTNDPIAKDIMAQRKTYPGGPPTPFSGFRLGELYVDEAYIYPPPATREEQTGIQLWECGRMELKPGIGPAGLCRVVVIDLKNQTVLHKRMYRGTMANPQSLPHDQLEVTWTEGGAVRIIGSAASQRWRWSQPRAAWDEDGCPPDEILQAIFAAMG